jgi:SAM-dependent methyltransferase
MDYSDAWQKEEHSKQFGKAIRKKNLLLFLSKFQRYLPARCLNYLILRSADKNISILDVGCAGGDFYAYLSCVASEYKWDYEGIDISEPAIKIARKHYGKDRFNLVSKDDDLGGREAEIVLSVDVLIHQIEPYLHLERIFNCARKYLLISLRTRETGNTVLDPDISCQRNYGQWVPFIIFNINQLYKQILGFTDKPLKITCFKEYKIFGGEGRRFLPKELYTEDPRTAITTLLIEKSENGAETEIEEHEYMSVGKFKKGHGFYLLSSVLGDTWLDRTVARTFSEKIRSIDEVLKYTNIVSTNNINISQIYK